MPGETFQNDPPIAVSQGGRPVTFVGEAAAYYTAIEEQAKTRNNPFALAHLVHLLDVVCKLSDALSGDIETNIESGIFIDDDVSIDFLLVDGIVQILAFDFEYQPDPRPPVRSTIPRASQQLQHLARLLLADPPRDRRRMYFLAKRTTRTEGVRAMRNRLKNIDRSAIWVLACSGLSSAVFDRETNPYAQVGDLRLVVCSAAGCTDPISQDRLDSVATVAAAAEDLVVGVQNGTTKLVEGQEYWIYIEDLKENDTVSITFTGNAYTYRVSSGDGSSSPETELTSQALEAIAALINNAIASDPHTRDGAIYVEYVDLETSDDNDGVLILRERENAKDYAEHVFIQLPEVTVTNGSGGEEAGVIVKETSDAAVVLFDYDFRSVEDTDGLNRSIGVNSQRDGWQFGENGVALQRFITFEDTTGISRSILQDAVAYETLLGLDVLVSDSANTNDPSDEILLQTALDTPADAYLLKIGGNINEEGPGHQSTPDDRGQPDIEAAEGLYSALHGDDLLIGSNGIETILGRTGYGRVIASRNFNLLDVETYDGGAEIIISGDGLVLENIANPSGLEQDERLGGEVKFYDTLLLQEGIDSNETDTFYPGSLFFITVSGVAEDGDSDIDHTMTFTNFELARTLSDTAMDSLTVTAERGDVTYDNSKNEGMLSFSADDAEGGAVQGVEMVTTSTGDDYILGGSDDTLNGGGGDDVDTGIGDDVAIETPLLGGKSDAADGDDNYDLCEGSDVAYIYLDGSTGDDALNLVAVPDISEDCNVLDRGSPGEVGGTAIMGRDDRASHAPEPWLIQAVSKGGDLHRIDFG